jgi:hypothetical protein
MISTDPWSQFLNLLPSSPRQIGDIIENVGYGKYKVQLIGGNGILTVMSGVNTLTVNTRVFIKDGVIESTAPTLSNISIDV